MPMARLPRQLPMQRQSRRWRPSSDATIVLDIEGAGGGMKTKLTLRIDSDLLRRSAHPRDRRGPVCRRASCPLAEHAIRAKVLL